jgi:hypothetical protein
VRIEGLERKASILPREVWTEIACARALLDELETVLDAAHGEQTRCVFVTQIADQLTRVANTMKEWEAGRGQQSTHLPSTNGKVRHQ